MKILILGDGNSVHIIKWITSLSELGIPIGLFSLADVEHKHFKSLNNFTSRSLELSPSIFKSGEGSFQKLNYLKALPKLKTFIKDFKPDILHSHYASSYGLLGRLADFHPFVVSVWGSDIYDFPKRNFIFRKIIEETLAKADYVLSTSHVMAVETAKYTDKAIEITPFGVDLNRFKPSENKVQKNAIVLGTIKALEDKYGIDILIKSFAKVLKERNGEKLSLEIIGKGTALENLKELCREEGVENLVRFKGVIDNWKVPEALNNLDIYLALSRWDSESFGVAIVEAQACEIPVIVSNKGGLPEVVEHDVTGLVVESENVVETAKAIHSLLDSPERREQMGKNGRLRVERLYDWQENVKQMAGIYAKIYEGTNEK